MATTRRSAASLTACPRRTSGGKLLRSKNSDYHRGAPDVYAALFAARWSGTRRPGTRCCAPPAARWSIWRVRRCATARRVSETRISSPGRAAPGLTRGKPPEWCLRSGLLKWALSFVRCRPPRNARMPHAPTQGPAARGRRPALRMIKKYPDRASTTPRPSSYITLADVGAGWCWWRRLRGARRRVQRRPDTQHPAADHPRRRIGRRVRSHRADAVADHAPVRPREMRA